MKTFNKWASGLAVIFLLALLCMAVNPASAAEKVKNTIAEDTIAQEAAENPGGVEQSVADPKGPPIFGLPGWYIKTHGKNAGTYKYFKNGHPENQSEWEYFGPDPPYGS